MTSNFIYFHKPSKHFFFQTHNTFNNFSCLLFCHTLSQTADERAGEVQQGTEEVLSRQQEGPRSVRVVQRAEGKVVGQEGGN